MIGFLAFAFLGLAAFAAFAWSRRRRSDVRSREIVMPAPTSSDAIQEQPPIAPNETDSSPTLAKFHHQSKTPDLPEATSSAMPPSVEERVGLPQLGEGVSDQPTNNAHSKIETDVPALVDNPTSAAPHRTSPLAFVATGSDVKPIGDIIPAHANELPQISEPPTAPQAADVNLSAPGDQTNALASLPPESAAAPKTQEKEPPVETPQQTPEKTTIPAKGPTYRPPTPVSSVNQARPRRPTNTRLPLNTNTNADLQLRVQLVFGRGGGVKTIALVPDHRDGMPDKLEITGTQGKQQLTKLKDDCYESVIIPGDDNALRQGVEWHGRGDTQRWRWVLGGRELYVLAEGDEFGLHGFVSRRKDPRLLLNARHVVLAAAHLRDEVLAALSETGCTTPEIIDDTTPGVPSGWLLFREVTPARAASMRGDAHILNALCPLPNIEPHFIGGIRLQERTWLSGFPPRIRFTGELGNGFRVTIDGREAHVAPDGAFEAQKWDDVQEHRLWFEGQSVTYTLTRMEEDWPMWHAHDFGTGAAICGANTKRLDGARWQQIRVPVGNPILVGAHPGEIFNCCPRNDVRCETILTMVPFAPVWALPLDSAHVDKRSARVVLYGPAEPGAINLQKLTGNRINNRRLAAWISAIREAGCKGLALSTDSEDAKMLWRRYRETAKQLWRRMR